MWRFCRLVCFPLAAAVLLSTSVQAQTYPSRPVKIVVPFAAGGGTDIVARFFAQKLSDKWGQAVVVENRAGADGMIGSAAVAKASPDGYTLLMVVPSHTINPNLKANMPYDAVKDFAPITLIASSPFVLAVSNQNSARDIMELIALAKSKPGQIAFGSSDPSTRLAGEQFKSLAGVDMFNVSYKGGSAVVSDLAGGHISVGFSSLMSTLPFHKQGNLRVLGVGTTSRSPLLPDVPTISEAGLPGYATFAWYGLCAPAGTGPEIIAKIQTAISQISAEPDVKARLLGFGATPVASTSGEFAAFIVSELAKSARTLKAAGINPE